MATLEEWGAILEKYEETFDERYGYPDLKAMLQDWEAEITALDTAVQSGLEIIRKKELMYQSRGQQLSNAMERIKELENHVEGIEAERDQYLEWFELHNFEVPEILQELYGESK